MSLSINEVIPAKSLSGVPTTFYSANLKYLLVYMCVIPAVHSNFKDPSAVSYLLQFPATDHPVLGF